MYATNFEYDGKLLSDYGCILTSFDGLVDGLYPSGADLTFSYTKPLGRDTYNLHNTSYETPYTVTFSICKNPCVFTDADESYLTPKEISTLQRWLCRRNKYCKLKIDADGLRGLYWMGSFTSQQYELGKNVIGLQLTFTADAPYAYADDIVLKQTLSANEKYVIDSLSDEEGYIYPDMKITLKSAGNLVITNNRDTKILSIKNCTNGEVITIDGKHLIISSSNASHDLGNDFNYSFPRLFNSYENVTNEIKPNLACTIELSYAPVVKVGI